MGAERLVRGGIGEISFHIADTGAELPPSGIILHGIVERPAQVLVVAVVMADAEQRHVLGEQASASEVNKRRCQQPAGEVPQCAEDDKGSRGCSWRINHWGIST